MHRPGEKQSTQRVARLPGILAGWVLLALVGLLGGCSVFQPYPDTSSFHTVILDAGHGGYDQGGRSVRGNNEKVLALDVARRVKPILERHGYRVILTRSSDVFIPLGQRCEIAARYPDSVFVSIHFNYASRRSASGLETYYYNPRYRRFAANIQQEILKTYRCPDRGVKSARFYVLRNNRRPAVLLELGFLSNAYDNKFAQDPRHRQRLAEAIARGILDERAGARP